MLATKYSHPTQNFSTLFGLTYDVKKIPAALNHTQLMNTKLQRVLKEHDLILMEASIEEALRTSTNVPVHPRLGNALMIYDDVQKSIMAEFYRRYISTAYQAKLPILLLTPTWRANYERLSEEGISKNVNADAVRFLTDLSETFGEYKDNILIAGYIGSKNDPYRPEESPAQDESLEFHTWQIYRLCECPIDLLVAGPLPTVSEATGIALAMKGRGFSYVLSFIINRDGKLLDSSSLEQAIEKIDGSSTEPPVGYMIGCSYPSFLNPQKQPASVLSRIIGYQANASSLEHSELDEAGENHADDISDWGMRMVELNKRFGVRVLGGCCGTRDKHLQCIVENMHSGQKN